MTIRPSMRRMILTLGLCCFYMPPTISAGVPIKDPDLLRAGQLFYRLPVSWELVRSGFNTLDVALEAETFTEEWGIYRPDPYNIFLITPHGMTRVVGLHLDSNSDTLFDTLAIPESQFASLLNIDHTPLDASERSVLIVLRGEEADNQKIILTASTKYFISVTLTINP